MSDLIKQFTDNYKKDVASNNYKLMQLIEEQTQDIKLVYKKISEWNDVDKAEGVALDTIGANINQYRGEVNDDIYRVLIKSRIARNRATGDYNRMIDVLSLAIDADKSEIVIEEADTEYNAIRIIQVPLQKLNSIGMSIEMFGRIVAKLTAAGVGIQTIEFYGTFQYVDTLENVLELGYADDNMTAGGTLGDVFKPSNDPNFPL